MYAIYLLDSESNGYMRKVPAAASAEEYLGITSFSKAWKKVSKSLARRWRADVKRQIRRKHRRSGSASLIWDARLVILKLFFGV